MMVAMAGYSFNDAFIKSTSDALPLFQAVFLRGVIACVLIGGLALADGAFRFRPDRRDLGLMGWRLTGEIFGTACFLTAVFNMPLADASAILQSVPLVVTLAAALILREPVGWRRYLAIAIGLVGVLIIVRPGSEGFDVFALWALAAVGFITMRDLSTRRMSAEAPALGIVFVTALAITLAAGAVGLVADWSPVEVQHGAALAISAVCLLVGYVFGVKSMRTGEIGFVQPFRYTLLIWAMLLGIVIFGDWPDAWMLAGSAIVIATGLFTLYREQRLGLIGSVKP